MVNILYLGLVFLLLNSGYLAAMGDPGLFYIFNLLLHLGAGLILLLIALLRMRSILRSLSLPGRFGVFLLITGGLVGCLLAWTGAVRPYKWLLPTHIALAVAGAVFLGLHYMLRFRENPQRSRIYLVALCAALLFPPAALVYNTYFPDAAARIVNPYSPPATMEQEGGGPQSPFFPSSARTTSGTTIPSTFFMTSESCKRCHPDIFDQWNSSAHHFSSFNNQWYRKSIEYMQDTIGTRPSKWCGGCHDHAVLFNGMMDTPIRQILKTPEAQAGLACTSCHAIVRVNSSMGQGDFQIEYPALHDLAASENPWIQKLHDFIVNTDPEPHRRIFIKPFMRKDTPEFCSSCHKVHLDVPVNNYRWFRGFNDYDNWQASGVSGQGARAFYYPPKSMKCADCHMPMVDSPKDPAADAEGKVKSHRFPGANTALPYVNRDEEQFRVVEQFLKNDAVTVDIFAFSREAESAPAAPVRSKSQEQPQLASTFAVGEEGGDFGAAPVTVLREPSAVIAPIDRAEAVVERGSSVRVDVVVRTRKVGHFFPGGTVDAFDVWLELKATDETGRLIYWSGRVEDDGKGPVEKGAHFYRALMLDGHGNPINKRNAWAARSVAYVRLIPPGAADTVHFRLEIPEDCGERIHLEAKLNYRKFAWWNTNWAFAGVRDPQHTDFEVTPHYDNGRWVFTGDTSTVSGKRKEIPQLPIVMMSQDAVQLRVVDAGAALPDAADASVKEDRERWNDYGIGLLLQGDLKGAERAFQRVTELEPEYADGWVNIARARIQEGNTTGAQEVLEKALKLDPGLAKTHFFYAMTLKSQGKYDAALEHLQVAAGKYPRDRVVVNQIGRVLFLQRRYAEAITELQKTLAIDPEDLQAHYNLMLCYQGTGNREMAEKERKLYERFKADEASQAITGPYRHGHPEDNRERQPIHEHVTAPMSPPAAPYQQTSTRRAADVPAVAPSHGGTYP